MNAADPYNDPKWTFMMACAWVAHRTRASVAAAARSRGGITRAAVEKLLRELRAGRLTAWARVDGKAFPIAPQRWRALEPVFVRKRLLPGFAKSFGRLMVTVRGGTDKEIRDVTISSEAMRQIFSADAPVIAAPVRGRTQARRDRARLGLGGVLAITYRPWPRWTTARCASEWHDGSLRTNHFPKTLLKFPTT